VVHSDQECQFTGHEWQTFLCDHHLASSMSWRGTCHDNAVAESFFRRFKRERMRSRICRIYTTRSDARADVSHYIEMFYNPQRRPFVGGRTLTGKVRAATFPTAQKCLGKPGRYKPTSFALYRASHRTAGHSASGKRACLSKGARRAVPHPSSGFCCLRRLARVLQLRSFPIQQPSRPVLQDCVRAEVAHDGVHIAVSSQRHGVGQGNVLAPGLGHKA
jgi:hypothetical protein